MRKSLLLFVLLFTVRLLSAQEIMISDSARISILTCSPGEEIYAKFGHTGLRVIDPSHNIDLVFNFGIFSFNTESFYLKFINGETDYQLGVYETAMFLSEYEARNSTVWEQKLNLKPAERHKLISALLTHYQPENRYYRYNFAYDNCSTRPLSMIKSSLNGHIEYPYHSEPETFRMLIGRYVNHFTWTGFGIDLLFGMDAEHYANKYESLFLPEILMNEFQYAKIVEQDKTKRALVEKKTVIIGDEKEAENTNNISLYSPVSFFSLVLVVGIILSFLKGVNRRVLKSFDTLLLLTSGLAGLLVCYMMAFSEHPLVGRNLNVLWLNPFNILAAFFLWVRPMRKVLFYYQIINISFLISALFVFGTSVQDFNLAVFPIITLMLLRYTKWAARAKQKIYSPRLSRRKSQSV